MNTPIAHRLPSRSVPGLGRRRRRGLTIVEFVMSITMFTFVGLVASGLLMVVGQQVRRSLSNLPSDANNYRHVDRIRAQLLPAHKESIVVGDAGRSITFHDPTRNLTSRIWFDGQTRTCYLQTDVSDIGSRSVWARVADCRFELLDEGRRVHVTVETRGRDRGYRPITLSHTDVITIRN